MLLKQIPNHAIILAPKHMHLSLRTKLLEEKKGILGIQILTFEAYVQRFFTHQISPLEITLTIHQILKQQSSATYQSLLDTYHFALECKNFLQDMKYYRITSTDLPAQHISQIERKQLLASIEHAIPYFDELCELANVLKTIDASHIYLCDTYLHPYEKYLYTILQEAGAHTITWPSLKQNIRFYSSMNMRKEVEQMARILLEENLCAEDVHVFVCEEGYKPIIQQVFQRYQIPFTVLKQSHTSIVIQRMIALLRYRMQPCQDTFFELLDVGIFSSPYLKDLREYMELFEVSIHDAFQHIAKIEEPSSLVDKKELWQLQQLEQRASEAQKAVLPTLVSLQEQDSLQDYLSLIYACSIQKDASLSLLKRIQDTLQTLQKQLPTFSDLPFYIEVLQELKEDADDQGMQGVLISDLTCFLPPSPYAFVLGCSQKNYPGTPNCDGLFDESYVKQIDRYPTLKQRYDLHLTLLEGMLAQYENLYLSYPLGTYQGKGNECSLEMEQFANQKPQYLEFHENCIEIPLSYQISQKYVHPLYLKDNRLQGSVSAFERYQSCPFSYFLRYGLQIKEPINYRFSQNRIGTLLHLILEILVDRYGKHYTDATFTEIETIIVKELDVLCAIYPSLKKQRYVLTRRLLDTIQKNFSFLSDMEAHSHLNDTLAETAFEMDIPLNIDKLSLHLRGIIDRIDMSAGYLRIIDYKSSRKSLSEEDIFSGLQLQLLTYAVYAKKQFHKEVLGAFYYSLKNGNLSALAGKFSRRPLGYVAYDRSYYEAEAKKKKQLTGWIFHKDIDCVDDDGTHIKEMKTSKAKGLYPSKIYRLDAIEQHLIKMYQIIGKKILEGHIDCTPTNDACMFCPYKEICRFKGYPKVLTPLVDYQDIEQQEEVEA